VSFVTLFHIESMMLWISSADM